MGLDYFEADIVLLAWKDLKMTRKEIEKRFNISSKKIERIFARTKIGGIKKSFPFVLKN